jgi:hypothetical protein
MKTMLTIVLLLVPSLALAQDTPPAAAPPAGAPPAAAAGAPTANPTPADPVALFRSAEFWPIYKKYEADFAKIQDGRVEMLKDYIANMNSMTDAKAKKFMTTVLERKAKMNKLRDQYMKELTKKLPATLVLRFFQIDAYLSTVMDLQIQSSFPLVS